MLIIRITCGITRMISKMIIEDGMMSEATIERPLKVGLMIDDTMHSVEMESNTNDIYVYEGKHIVQHFNDKAEFAEFYKLICIAREEMEKE